MFKHILIIILLCVFLIIKNFKKRLDIINLYMYNNIILFNNINSVITYNKL